MFTKKIHFMKNPLLLFSLILGLAACQKNTGPSPLEDVTSVAQFQAMISGSPSLVFFHSPSCSQCKKIRPEIEALLNEQSIKSVKFGEVNYGSNADIVDNANVHGFPTVLIFKEGKEEHRLLGANHSKDKMKELLLDLID